MKYFLWLLCSVAWVGLADSQKLTLNGAFELALENSPRLKAASQSTTAASAAVQSAGLWQNPKLKFSAEGIGGDLDGFNDTEYEIGLSQMFERGGKRTHAKNIALRAVDVAVQRRAEQELELLAEVRQAFIDVFSQQEIGDVRSEQEQLGRAFVDVAKSRYEAGGSSELDVVQAELALEEILLSQTCCFGDLEAARIRLASLIGIPEPEMPELTGDYYDLEDLSDRALAESHPVLKRLDAQIDLIRSEAALARASDSMDVTLQAGIKHEAAEDLNTFVVGALIPLNFVRGGRAAEVAALARAEARLAERREVQRLYQQQLATLNAVYRGAKIEAEMTSDRLVPKAEQAYEVSKAGYDAGRFSWFELISAQQSLTEIRVRYIEALRDAHFARAEISKFMEEEL